MHFGHHHLLHSSRRLFHYPQRDKVSDFSEIHHNELELADCVVSMWAVDEGMGRMKSILDDMVAKLRSPDYWEK
jgi:hypothetical protein